MVYDAYLCNIINVISSSSSMGWGLGTKRVHHGGPPLKLSASLRSRAIFSTRGAVFSLRGTPPALPFIPRDDSFFPLDKSPRGLLHWWRGGDTPSNILFHGGTSLLNGRVSERPESRGEVCRPHVQRGQAARCRTGRGIFGRRHDQQHRAPRWSGGASAIGHGHGAEEPRHHRGVGCE